mmetsp:Transcript_14327/g.49807  ORF Transcript_14327/g.49807 Transcript_14327/m.49807 type:complete len:219 (+) Transcript_14327:582-1238(+)
MFIVMVTLPAVLPSPSPTGSPSLPPSSSTRPPAPPAAANSLPRRALVARQTRNWSYTLRSCSSDRFESRCRAGCAGGSPWRDRKPDGACVRRNPRIADLLCRRSHTGSPPSSAAASAAPPSVLPRVALASPASTAVASPPLPSDLPSERPPGTRLSCSLALESLLAPEPPPPPLVGPAAAGDTRRTTTLLSGADTGRRDAMATSLSARPRRSIVVTPS